MCLLSSYYTAFKWFWHILSLPWMCRGKASNSIKKQSYQSLQLILFIAFLYCLWCASQIYWISPRRPAVGEEADLGVLIFLATFFFLPHGLCIMSMFPKDLNTDQIPLWQCLHFQRYFHALPMQCDYNSSLSHRCCLDFQVVACIMV